MNTVMFVTAGSFVSWFAAAKLLFRHWVRNETTGDYTNAAIAVTSMVVALFWPVALVVAGIMHNPPKSPATVKREIAALEAENNTLRRQQSGMEYGDYRPQDS